MSRLSRSDREVLVDHARVLLLSGFASGVSDAAALTSSAITLTYTTDNPAYTPDGSVVIADGDSVSAANELNLIEEMERVHDSLFADATALRTAVNAMIGDNIFDVTAPGEMTTVVPSTALSSEIVDLNFTTDAPSLTVNGTATIADGDLTTAAEFVLYFIEWNAMMRKLVNDYAAVFKVVNQIVRQRSFQGVSAPAALTSTSGFLTVTYTTDAPSITPDATLVIADGDTITVAERNNAIAEFEESAEDLRDDLVAIRASLDAWLAIADIA